MFKFSSLVAVTVLTFLFLLNPLFVLADEEVFEVEISFSAPPYSTFSPLEGSIDGKGSQITLKQGRNILSYTQYLTLNVQGWEVVRTSGIISGNNVLISNKDGFVNLKLIPLSSMEGEIISSFNGFSTVLITNSGNVALQNMSMSSLNKTNGNGYIASIYNGYSAPTAPEWIVYVMSDSNCSGSLIDPEWVLTAKHCLFLHNEEIPTRVVIGALHLNDGESLKVTKVISSGNGEDWAFLKLERPSQMDPVTLKLTNQETLDQLVGKGGSLMGYGSMAWEWTGYNYTNTLQMGGVGVITCPLSRILGQLCITGLSELRPGDSGGPFFYAGSIYGVASIAILGEGIGFFSTISEEKRLSLEKEGLFLKEYPWKMLRPGESKIFSIKRKNQALTIISASSILFDNEAGLVTATLKGFSLKKTFIPMVLNK